MVKNQKPKPNDKKTAIKKLLLILSPIILILTLVIGFLIYKSISDYFDHVKFNTLNTEMSSLFQEIKSQANSGDDWQYKNICSPQMSGDWETGGYYCNVTISLTADFNNTSEVTNRSNKYYSIISTNKTLIEGTTPITAPSVSPSITPLGYMEKNFKVSKTGSDCRYESIIRTENKNKSNSKQVFVISLECGGSASGEWHPREY